MVTMPPSANCRMAGVALSSEAALAPTPWNMKKSQGLPMSPSPPTSLPKERLNPHTTHRMLMMPMAMNDWRMVLMTFFLPTIPP